MFAKYPSQTKPGDLVVLGGGDLELALWRVRHSLAQLYISADRLSRLVRQLLSLARNEPGALDTVQLQPLDLNAFALDISMEWVPQAIRRNIDLGFEGVEQPLMIDADRDRNPGAGAAHGRRGQPLLTPASIATLTAAPAWAGVIRFRMTPSAIRPASPSIRGPSAAR